MKILLAQINPTIGDFKGNTAKIREGFRQARERGADLVLFPELCVSGYPPEDFLLMPHFIQAAIDAFESCIPESKGIWAILGTIRKSDKGSEKELCNSAAILHDGKLIGFQDKTLLPTYDVFDERRYFEPANKHPIWEIAGKRVAVTICEDIWHHPGQVFLTDYKQDPIMDYKGQEIDLVVNIAASPFHLAKFHQRVSVCTSPAKTLNAPLVMCNQVGGNDSLIFDGFSLAVTKDGQVKAVAKGFEEDFLLVDTEDQTSFSKHEENSVRDLYEALCLGLKDYFHKSGLTKACLGLSGGIDSAVTLCIAEKALGKENLLAVMLPSRYSSDASVTDADELLKNLGVKSWNLSIEPAFNSFLQTLEPKFEGRSFDVTEENLQARIRGTLLMAISNKLGYIVLSTGNKSELAMGYSTLYGDMVGGLGVLSDVTKRQVYQLAHWINKDKQVIPENIIKKAPSAELRENQKDSDSLPDYEIVDNVVEGYVEQHKSPKEIARKWGYPLELVEQLVKKIHLNEYKRRQSAPGLRVSKKAFSIGRRFPIVQAWV